MKHIQHLLNFIFLLLTIIYTIDDTVAQRDSITYKNQIFFSGGREFGNAEFFANIGYAYSITPKIAITARMDAFFGGGGSHVTFHPNQVRNVTVNYIAVDYHPVALSIEKPDFSYADKSETARMGIAGSQHYSLGVLFNFDWGKKIHWGLHPSFGLGIYHSQGLATLGGSSRFYSLEDGSYLAAGHIGKRYSTSKTFVNINDIFIGRKITDKTSIILKSTVFIEHTSSRNNKKQWGIGSIAYSLGLSTSF